MELVQFLFGGGSSSFSKLFYSLLEDVLLAELRFVFISELSYEVQSVPRHVVVDIVYDLGDQVGSVGTVYVGVVRIDIGTVNVVLLFQLNPLLGLEQVDLIVVVSFGCSRLLVG